MDRAALDKLISATGLVIGLALLAAAGGLFYAYHFIHSQVHDQLVGEHIMFPAKDSAALKALPAADRAKVELYAGQQLLTGAQAKVFADNYIAVHLREIGGGKSYSQLSAESMASPDDTELANKVSTVFRGEMLRGVLQNVYAFDTMALVARTAAIGAVITSVLLFILAALGLRHARQVTRKYAN